MTTRADVAAIRFGYGYRPGGSGPKSADDLLRELRSAPVVPKEMARIETPGRIARFRQMRRAQRMMADGEGKKAARKRLRRELGGLLLADQHARVAAAVRSQHPFFERLVSFWADHFTVSAARREVTALAGPFEIEAIRPHVLGPFHELLLAATMHPAMLLYLDQAQSIGPNSRAAKRRGRGGLNENLAREVLELHSLGVDGGYAQADVTELARLLTGWTVRLRNGGGFRFEPRIAEPGVKQVLGKRYGSAQPAIKDAVTALVDIAFHPATARHIATKLARHFVSDEPPAAIVDALERSFRNSNGDLGAVYRTLLERPEPWQQFAAKVKPPFDFVVSGLRAVDGGAWPLGPRQRKGRLRPNPATVGALHLMNQPVYRAPGPDGWPDEARAWITPQGLALRLEWAAGVARRLRDRDPREFLRQALGHTASEETRFVVANASSREEGLALVFASPEFNRR
ncbi:MAG: DUF1800 domain-containing protein [Alphaproteobacteria bacterium]|jgi:uncharacterized protein (DUF1800 family)|nr:DUF1800 domain-containing protein [Alphaproteobacteria bacterium]